ncbi:uncharacterized protein K02A2.6-like [Cydia fagiglandana]|uniref:uncharacterized protein K02A2.6-like n=1 Tax=Cydia fagiglandana TaxID=1458189 RepID=UPI002FEE154E
MPYALRERVDAELDAMLRENIIEPVDCSEWASPLVPVNKADEVKTTLTSTDVLAHYDPKKVLIVTCDASARGVGGVLAQPGPIGERPVAFASRSLTPAEKNYSQIHREALSIIYCMKKFHQYLYGRKFVLRTDHKPLVSIFGPNAGIPTMTASRMQRWAVILSAYDYEIEYIKTNENCADGLSRLPPGADAQASAAEVVPEQTYLHFVQDALLLDYSQLKRLTAEDNMLQRLLSFIRDGWPETCEVLAMKPYFNRQSELYEELGCVMWGHRLVVPEGCRKQILDLIHEPHMGVVKSKALARSYVWWPGIDEALERTCLACTVCAVHADDPPRATPCPWRCPAQAWSRLHLDFMGPIAGKTYLVAVDATSKWLEIFPVPSTAAKFTVNKLSELFSRFGNPRQVVTDNGPPFTSNEFDNFIKNERIEHVFTPPYHPASNGAAENAVKTLKRVIKKALTESKDVDMALHTFLKHYRNTNHASTGESSAAVLQKRHLRTKLDALKPDLNSGVVNNSPNSERSGGRTFSVGQDIWFRQYLKGEKWLPGKISSSNGPSDYTVSDITTGKHIHRHVDQLRRRVGTQPVNRPDTECFASTSRSLAMPLPDSTRTGSDQSEIPSTSTPTDGTVPLSPAPAAYATPTAITPSPAVPSPSTSSGVATSANEPQTYSVSDTPVPPEPRPSPPLNTSLYLSSILQISLSILI